MPYIDDLVLDAALDFIDASVENLYICSQEPVSYAEAQTTYKLGTKSAPGITAPEDGDVTGRKVVITAITDGVVDATGNADSWALCDNSESLLLAAGPLDSPQDVTAANTFTLEAFDIEFPEPA